MSEVKGAGIDRMLSKPPKDLAAALIFGPDQGLVRERAETLIKAIVPNLKDPFLIADLDDGVLTSDPARLFDEAAAIAMLGGRRVVRGGSWMYDARSIRTYSRSSFEPGALSTGIGFRCAKDV